MKPQILFFYHMPCFDGFGAYYYAKKFFSSAWRVADYSIRYLEISYGLKHEAQFSDPGLYPKGSLIFFADYCPTSETLVMLRDRGCTIIVLDHHKTALDAVSWVPDFKSASGFTNFSTAILNWEMNVLNGVGAISKVFDMDRSGAGITYDFFWGTYELLEKDITDRKLLRRYRGQRPVLVRYLEDRDLWKFKHPDSKEINAFIQSFEWSYVNYDKLDSQLSINGGVAKAVHAGQALLQEVDKTVKMITGDKIKVVTVFDGEVERRVGFFNATSHWSEVGNHVAKTMKDVDISCSIYFDFVKHSVLFSLRSSDGDKVDCSKLAVKLGGGGHKAASGAVMRIGDAMQFLQANGVL